MEKLPRRMDSDNQPPNKDITHEDENAGVQTIIEPKPRTRVPSLYKVILLNDDYTPMDFVVNVLIKFFAKSEPEATSIMLQVHHQGRGIAGTYSFEIAETKAHQAQSYAKLREYPLKCVLEKE